MLLLFSATVARQLTSTALHDGSSEQAALAYFTLTPLQVHGRIKKKRTLKIILEIV